MSKYIITASIICISDFLINYGLNGLLEIGKITPGQHTIFSLLELVFFITCIGMTLYAWRLENERA